MRERKDRTVSFPKWAAGPDDLFRFSSPLADVAAMLVAKRSGIELSLEDRETWAELFNDTVRPNYEQPHTIEQMEGLERQLRRFITHTAANHLQI